MGSHCISNVYGQAGHFLFLITYAGDKVCENSKGPREGKLLQGEKFFL